MKPLYLTSKTENQYLPDAEMPSLPSGERKEKNIILTPVKCFERMIRKNTRCHSCFYPSISTSTVVKFKRVAYTLVRTTTRNGSFVPENLSHKFNRSEPIRITHMYRGPNASRHIANIELIQGMLAEAFPSPKYYFQSINSSDDNRGYAEQIKIAAQAQVNKTLLINIIRVTVMIALSNNNSNQLIDNYNYYYSII